MASSSSSLVCKRCFFPHSTLNSREVAWNRNSWKPHWPILSTKGRSKSTPEALELSMYSRLTTFETLRETFSKLVNKLLGKWFHSKIIPPKKMSALKFTSFLTSYFSSKFNDPRSSTIEKKSSSAWLKAARNFHSCSELRWFSLNFSFKFSAAFKRLLTEQRRSFSFLLLYFYVRNAMHRQTCPMLEISETEAQRRAGQVRKFVPVTSTRCKSHAYALFISRGMRARDTLYLRASICVLRDALISSQRVSAADSRPFVRETIGVSITGFPCPFSLCPRERIIVIFQQCHSSLGYFY